MNRIRPALIVLVVTSALVGSAAAADASPHYAKTSKVLLSDSFTAPDGLITNEYAFWNPTATDAVTSPIWQLTSGSLFDRDDTAWTGVPDDVSPNATSTNGTDSAVFRMRSSAGDFGNVKLSISLLNRGLTQTATTPPESWDGVHLWLRYQSEYSLYALSVNRRDGVVAIKKKCPGGTTNGGTYYTLGARSGYPIPFGTWQSVAASAHTNASGSVSLQIWWGSSVVLSATDAGQGCPPITTPGRVGVRGDNDNFQFDSLRVISY